MLVTPVMLLLTHPPNSTNHASHTLTVRALSQEGKTEAQVLPLREQAQTPLSHLPETT